MTTHISTIGKFAKIHLKQQNCIENAERKLNVLYVRIRLRPRMHIIMKLTSHDIVQNLSDFPDGQSNKNPLLLKFSVRLYLGFGGTVLCPEIK